MMCFHVAESSIDNIIVTIEGVGGCEEVKELPANDSECYTGPRPLTANATLAPGQ
ncbi:hypothetical protein DPMN_075273 [Dreissena polymorpha]|uniref:Uncharacterized protein n=1 Tax=Dreissena polymorpha TaxID=45954 RepID=A0A9D3YK30_DREPO|nr:hypothetical protein DPMN_075273 [Dreissena polymorpha]